MDGPAPESLPWVEALLVHDLECLKALTQELARDR